MITKEKVAIEAKGRRVRFHDVTTWDDGYGGHDTVTNRWDEPLATANMVSSIDSKGLHRPALDIDLPVVLVPAKPGHFSATHLWIDVKCSDRAYQNLIKVLREFRIIDVGYLIGLNKQGSEECYAMDAKETQTPRALTDYMIENFATFKGSFDQLLYKAAEETKPTRSDLVRGPAMKNPRLLPLFVDAYLVESSANYHLYLDTILSWDGYYRVLEALRKARIINKSWLQLSLQLKRTDLRPPWAQKNRPWGAR
jgi:hypothetical protein